MNQKQIKATLYEENDVDYLRFDFSDDLNISVNLNSAESQKQLKEVFSNMLMVLLESDVEILYVVSDGYSRQMYIDVCEEYIKDLNREMPQIRQQMRRDLCIQDS